MLLPCSLKYLSNLYFIRENILKILLDNNMSDNFHQQCEICRESFPPDSRVGNRQHVCNKLTCQLEKKRRYNQQWRARKENTYYFKGRYPYLKEWLKRNPGYLKNYRARQKSIFEQKFRDIQVQLTTNNKKKLDAVQIINDIQVELNTNINNGKRRLQQSLF